MTRYRAEYYPNDAFQLFETESDEEARKIDHSLTETCGHEQLLYIVEELAHFDNQRIDHRASRSCGIA